MRPPHTYHPIVDVYEDSASVRVFREDGKGIEVTVNTVVPDMYLFNLALVVWKRTAQLPRGAYVGR